MNWNLRLFFVPILALSIAGPGLSAESPSSKNASPEGVRQSAPKQTAKTKKPKAQKFTGNISAVDSKTGAVSVKASEAEKSFMTQDAAKDALERLAVGDRVRVLYSEKEGKLMATSVRRVKLPQSKTKAGAQTSKSKAASSPVKDKAQ
jgi:ribosomal protein S1